jgi:hypothetical protein
MPASLAERHRQATQPAPKKTPVKAG